MFNLDDMLAGLTQQPMQQMPIDLPKGALGNEKAIAMMQPEPEMLPEKPEWREPRPNQGMFGIRGTGRDILGLIGDAFLVQAGRNPVYRGVRQQEREAEAMQGFVDNPMAAIEALARENPEAAREFFIQQQQAERLGRAANEDYTGTVMDRAFRMLGTATPENYDQLRPQIEAYMAGRGVKLPFTLPQTYDEEAIQGLRYGAVPVDKQIDDEDLRLHRQRSFDDLSEHRRISREIARERARVLGEQGYARLEQGEERLDLTESDPRRTAPNQTQHNIYADLTERQLSGEELTPEEETWMRQYEERTTPPNRRGRGRGRGRGIGGTVNLRPGGRRDIGATGQSVGRQMPGGLGRATNRSGVVNVRTPEEAAALPPGTVYRTPDDRLMTR